MAERTVNFTQEDVKNYLDKCIRFWREKRRKGDYRDRKMAPFYVDAYQSVRMSLFGELLGKE